MTTSTKEAKAAKSEIKKITNAAEELFNAVTKHNELETLIRDNLNPLSLEMLNKLCREEGSPYSLRTVAKKLKCSPSYISKCILGKNDVSPKTFLRLCKLWAKAQSEPPQETPQDAPKQSKKAKPGKSSGADSE